MSILKVKDGSTWVDVPAIVGPAGEDGYSPTVDVQEIEGGHEVTITDADGPHSFDVMDGDPAAPGSITDAMLAPDGIKPQVVQLWGNQLTGELSGTIDTAADAYAAPPMALTVNGASTQAGTPTPDAPVPILSVDDLTVHASADGGTTDYTNWPVSDLLPEGTPLRSLPDGTKDTLNLSYLRPSTRAGWAWYSREVVQNVAPATFDGTDMTGWSITNGTYPFYQFVWGNKAGSDAYDWTGLTATNSRCSNCTYAIYISTGNNAIGYSNTNYAMRYRYQDMEGKTASLTDLAEFFADSPVTFMVPMQHPVTTQLDPIELPTLPAPNATVWCDGGSAQPTFVMQYVRDTNIVIANMQAILDDLVTS